MVRTKLTIFISTFFIMLGVSATNQREMFQLDKGWKFHYGDIKMNQVTSHHGVYSLVKAGNSRGPTGFNYDTSTWQTVDVPHDYVIDGKHDKNQSVSHGFLPRPASWYRRQLKLENSDRNKTVWLYFDGVGGKTTVWINGQEVHHHNNGYIGFRINISDIANYGDKPNTIALRTDPSEPQGWWYEGGGIYRHVWLVKAAKVHVAPFGVFSNPKKGEGDNWLTQIETTVESELNQDLNVVVKSIIVDPNGEIVATTSDTLIALSRENSVLKQTIAIDAPLLWDIETPNLYKIITQISENNEIIDNFETTYGYRTIIFDANEGISLNGKPVKFKGVCMHQDHAGVGVAVPDAIQDFRVARLKEMGVNAYRCSHNPPATELLQACDRHGMLVMNENRFYNSAPEYLAQLKEQVLRDRNHPSNIMWSLFNEEPWQGDERGRKMVERMAHLVKKLDDSRPTSGAMNGGYNVQGAFSAVDILGINYNMGSHDRAHKMFPNKHVFGSENVSHFATRGEFVTDHGKYTFDNYDKHCAGWGSGVRAAWKHVNTRKWNGGMFIWTGFDYRGEPTPKAWPVINSFFGIMDTCGFAKDSFYLCQALWTEKPMAHVFPHWTHNDSMIGKEIKVGIYTNGDEVELVLNGKPLGRHKVSYYEQLFVPVKYSPGKLELKAFKNGKLHATNFVETVGKPVSLGIEAKFGEWERKTLESGNRDAFPVAVYATDAKGRRVLNAQQKVTFSVVGGKVIGVGNGDPTCHEADRAIRRSLFNGLASGIIEVSDNVTEIEITVKAPGLKPATLRLPVTKAIKVVPQYPTIGNDFVLADWRMSFVTKDRRDPNEKIADNDMNTWESIMVGTSAQVQFEDKLGYAVYRTSFEMPRDDKSWSLEFAEIVGRAELYINEQKVGEKRSFEKGGLKTIIGFKGGKKVIVSLLLEANTVASGITKTVSVVQLSSKRRPGSKPVLTNATLLYEGAFELNEKWQIQNLPLSKPVRYVALQTLNSFGNRNFAHAAELRFVGENGEISTKDITIHYVSSEEVVGENAKAENLFDNNPNTFWHSQWKGSEPKHPHVIVLDLGKARKLKAVKYLARKKMEQGPIRQFKIFVSNNNTFAQNE